MRTAALVALNDTYSAHAEPATQAASITVVVGHSSSLVSAGLAAMLSRTPGCQLKLQQISPAECSYPSARPAELVFGDSNTLRCMQAQAKASPSTCNFAKAKFVLVGGGDELAETASKVHADERVSLECDEQELFATVQKLINFDSAPSWSNLPPANRGLPMARTRESLPRGGLAPGTLRRVREHVDKNLTGKLRSEDLATVAGLSPGHFNRAFKQSIGQPPHQYILRRRVAVASELLEKTDRALAEIALEVGFADQSHFSRTYASVTGETPSACRRRNR